MMLRVLMFLLVILAPALAQASCYENICIDDFVIHWGRGFPSVGIVQTVYSNGALTVKRENFTDLYDVHFNNVGKSVGCHTAQGLRVCRNASAISRSEPYSNMYIKRVFDNGWVQYGRRGFTRVYYHPFSDIEAVSN